MFPCRPCGSIRLLLWVGGQKHAIAEYSFKAFDRAVLVTSGSGAAADSDGADHLAVDDDGKAAGIGEESELHQLPGIAARIIAQLRVADRSRLARLQGGLRLQHGRMNVGVDLAVAAFLMNECSV